MNDKYDKYVIAKYLRLSIDDGDKAESDSIANQRSLIDFYIEKEFVNREIETIELIDDGYTGTNMDRPSVKKLLILAETRSINCIIVKDFSRFSRDYIDAGRYVEQKFPEWEIRFIAVNDNYDSRDYRGITGGTDVALKNIVYTLYSRDLSEKIKSARRIQYKMGKYNAPYAFYGYIKDPNNKGKIIIDEKAAEVVRRIFNMRLSGMFPRQIAVLLNKDEVLTPSEYKKSIDPLCRKWNSTSNYKLWTANMVKNILYDERYTGKMISGKWERVSVGSQKVKRAKNEDLIIVENTHESIISQELFDDVSALIHRFSNSKANLENHSSITLKGLIRCGGCKHIMAYYKLKRQEIKYFCKYEQFTDINDCFCGKVYESELLKVVSTAIKTELIKAVDKSAIFKRVKNKTNHILSEIDAFKRKISEETKRKTQEYILLTKNQITDEEFNKRRDAINERISAYGRQIEDLQQEKISSESLMETGIFEKYIGIDEINQEIVKDLIKAIYVYHDKRIEIVWNFSEKKY